jgi:hypothetical protein
MSGSTACFDGSASVACLVRLGTICSVQSTLQTGGTLSYGLSTIAVDGDSSVAGGLTVLEAGLPF